MSASRGRLLGRLLILVAALTIGWGFLFHPSKEAWGIALTVGVVGTMIWLFIQMATGPSLIDLAVDAAQIFLDANAEEAKRARASLAMQGPAASGSPAGAAWTSVDRGGLLLQHLATSSGVTFEWAHSWPQGTTVIGARISEGLEETHLFSRSERRGRFVDTSVKPGRSYKYRIHLSLTDSPFVGELLGGKLPKVQALARQCVFEERITIPLAASQQEEALARLRAQLSLEREKARLRVDDRLERERQKAELKLQVFDFAKRFGLSERQVSDLIDEIELGDK